MTRQWRHAPYWTLWRPR